MNRLAAFLLLACVALTHDVAQAQAEPPWAWSFAPAAPRRVHVVHGVWTLEYRIPEALARGGGALVSDSFHEMGCGFGHLGEWTAQGGGVANFPDRWGQLLNQHLLIVANVDGQSLGGERAQKIRDFVEAGGAVLFLGGRHAFGPTYHGTSLEEICPVTFAAAGLDLQHAPSGAALEPQGKVLADLNWQEQPRVFWRHQATPKPESEVWLSADGRPLLVVGRFGKGRVAVFAGSVMGDPPADALPFWKWREWPTVLSRTIAWLLEPAERAPRGFTPQNIARLKSLEGGVEELLDVEDVDAAPKLNPETAQEMAAAAELCHDAASSRFLMELIASLPSDVPSEISRRAGRMIRPHVDARFAPLAQKMIASGLPYKTALGLRLLGLAGGPDAEATLLKFYKAPQLSSANVVSQKPSTSGVDLNPEADENARALREAAAAGLADRGTPAALAALKTILADTEGEGKFKPRSYSVQISPENMIYQQALMGALRCGDASTAASVYDVLMQNGYTLLRARLERTKADDLVDRALQASAEGMLWQAELVEQLNRVPDAMLPALAAAAATQTDRRAAEFALALFAGRKIPAEAAEKLKSSPIAAIRVLGGASGEAIFNSPQPEDGN